MESLQRPYENYCKVFLILTNQGHFELYKDSTNVHPLHPFRKHLKDKHQQKEGKTKKEGVRCRKQELQND